jgi:hypothetical protein
MFIFVGLAMVIALNFSIGVGGVGVARTLAEERLLLRGIRSVPEIVIGERAISSGVHLAVKIAHKDYRKETRVKKPLSYWEYCALFFSTISIIFIILAPHIYSISFNEVLYILLEEAVPSFEVHS